MKLFKNIFKSIKAFASRVYNSRGFEIASFALDSVNSTVEWVKTTSSFIDQMKLVIATIAIIGKYIKSSILNKLCKKSYT